MYPHGAGHAHEEAGDGAETGHETVQFEAAAKGQSTRIPPAEPATFPSGGTRGSGAPVHPYPLSGHPDTRISGGMITGIRFRLCLR